MPQHMSQDWESRIEKDAYLVVVDPVAHFFRYVTTARKKGLKIIVLSATPEVCRAEEKGHARIDDAYCADGVVDLFLGYDADDEQSALDVLAPYRDRIVGLVAGDEVTVAATARLGRALGFPYASEQDAGCQQIKSLMKQRLVSRNVRTPAFRAVSTLEEATAAFNALGRDCMLKMVDYAMSYGVYRVRSPQELAERWSEIEARRGQLDHGFSTVDTVLVEEHIGGREFSVEGYEQGGRIEVLNFCEKLSHQNLMVVGHYIPARTSDAEAEALCDVARDCVSALGIRNSVFHAEVHLFEGQGYIIECAARPPGQYSVGVLERIYGFDLMDLSIDLARGKPVAVRSRPPSSWNAIMALYAEKSGIVRSIDALDELRARPECYAVKCAVEPGDPVNQLETFRDVLGLALLEAPDPDAIQTAYDWARSSVHFRV
ncbi:MAG: hypothetical protein BM562_07035 [Alphaproteobacteria bacterium MedPE-SWcel]|nr:MAG: hypothetical protein BM562_07035 [Alphaproteobacteria bacterium MedPE-SWcel]